MAIIKINVDEVKIGMYIEKLDTSWFYHPFLGNSVTIKSEADLAKLLKSKVKYAYIDTEKGFYNIPRKKHVDTEDPLQGLNLKGVNLEKVELPEDKVPLYEEIKIARQLYHKTRKVIENVFRSVKHGKSINWDNVLQCTDEMTKSILRNKDAFVNLSLVKDHDNYTFYHSMNVCCLCLTMGRYLCFDKKDLMALGLGALLHDIGKIRIPQKILNKPGKLSEEEFSLIKRHPEFSRQILLTCSSIKEESINLAYEHHERFDGRGYPRGLKGFDIHQFALIAAIADVFDAITTDRPYRKAMPVDVAMRKIFEWGEKDFAPSYMVKFAQCMGTYPVGTVLELDNGEIGIVAAINHVDLERPKIIGILDSKHGKLQKPKIIDLASEEYRKNYIKRCFDAGKLGINVIRLLDYYLDDFARQVSGNSDVKELQPLARPP